MAKMRTDLTHKRLKELLSYNPETGVFVWLVSSSNRAPVGSVAGHYHAAYGYWVIGVDGVVYRAQRLAWLYVTGRWPEGLVDHINMDRADNRWANLRAATHSQNHANAGLISSNTSGHKGVSRFRNGKWHAYITVNKKRIHLGYFAEISDAAGAYAAAATKYFGEYARAL